MDQIFTETISKQEVNTIKENNNLSAIKNSGYYRLTD